MGPSLKRRKIIDNTASRRAFNQSIGAFGKLTKAGIKAQHHEGKADAISCATESDTERRRKKPAKAESRKRGREEEGSTETRKLDDRSINVETPPPRIDAKPQPSNNLTPSTPERSRKKAKLASRSTITDTPTKGARSFLESFVISSPRANRLSSPEPYSSPPSSIDYSVTTAVKNQIKYDDDTEDLIDLHSSFLNALSIHYAHNGTSSPADIRLLVPGIKQQWGKRHITQEDLQRLVGIHQYGLGSGKIDNGLLLVDYGRSKACIEYDSQSDSAFPVEILRQRFLSSLEKILKSGESIPLAHIVSLQPNQRGLSKGAQRLAEIKARPQDTPQQSAPEQSTSKSSSAQSIRPDNRAQSLVERIRMKEIHAASMPAPPSEEALARRAALMRLEEIIPVLEILSGSSSTSVASKSLCSASSSQASLDALMKPSLASLGTSLGLGPASPVKVVSFTMNNLVQQLQNSLKHPIAKDEAERCVRLLAVEVAPRWVGIRKVVRVEGVTFRGKIGRAEWTGRLDELISAF